MDLKKTGSFLRELRKERQLTQEQLAEKLNVSPRTVSRWETGTNLPDLDLLIELADEYDLDIRELIDGERKDTTMDAATKETLKKVADYTDAERKMLTRRMADMTIAALIIFVFYLVVNYTGFVIGKPFENLEHFALGLTAAALVLNILFCTGVLDKIRNSRFNIFRSKKERS